MATKKNKQSTKNKKSTKKLNFGKISPLKMLVAAVVVIAIAGIGIYMLNKGKAASAGSRHTCTIKADKTLWCWGQNDLGQLGIGNFKDQKVPKQVNITGVASVSAGSRHTCATKTDGTLWCWGYGMGGRLGTGNTRDQKVPKQVNITGVASVSAGGGHTCATKTDGTLWCWGMNNYSQLGIGTTTEYYLTDQQTVPKQVNITGVASVSAGDGLTCATKTDGTLWCWGHNDSGQLGIGNYVDQKVPMQVNNITGVASVSAGMYRTCATKTDGTLWCWGSNYYGRLGIGSDHKTIPYVLIPMQLNITGVAMVDASGFTHSCATKTDGTVWCWGNSGNGALGLGDLYSDTFADIPTQVKITGVASVGVGYWHTCATKTDGTLWCWGANDTGQLGLGNNTWYYVPMQVNITGVKP